jgi:hypothetical protein
MGKASSAKKVARAARAGGKRTGQRRQLGYPMAVVAIVVAGVGLVTFAKASGESADSTNPPQAGDHWHAAYGVYVCDRFIDNFSDREEDRLGIHTHDDGLIHVHPFSGGAGGRNATLGKFFDQVDLDVDSSEIQLPSGDPFKEKTYREGETTCGKKPATIRVAHWKSALKAAQGAKPDKVFTDDIGDIRLSEDLGAYTFAFVPRGTPIPPPPASADILTKATVDGGGTSGVPEAGGQPLPGVDGSTPLPSESAPPGSESAPPGSETAPPSESTPASSAPPSTAAP